MFEHVCRMLQINLWLNTHSDTWHSRFLVNWKDLTVVTCRWNRLLIRMYKRSSPSIVYDEDGPDGGSDAGSHTSGGSHNSGEGKRSSLQIDNLTVPVIKSYGSRGLVEEFFDRAKTEGRHQWSTEGGVGWRRSKVFIKHGSSNDHRKEAAAESSPTEGSKREEAELPADHRRTVRLHVVYGVGRYSRNSRRRACKPAEQTEQRVHLLPVADRIQRPGCQDGWRHRNEIHQLDRKQDVVDRHSERERGVNSPPVRRGVGRNRKQRKTAFIRSWEMPWARRHRSWKKRAPRTWCWGMPDVNLPPSARPADRARHLRTSHLSTDTAKKTAWYFKERHRKLKTSSRSCFTQLRNPDARVREDELASATSPTFESKPLKQVSPPETSSEVVQERGRIQIKSTSSSSGRLSKVSPMSPTLDSSSPSFRSVPNQQADWYNAIPSSPRRSISILASPRMSVGSTSAYPVTSEVRASGSFRTIDQTSTPYSDYLSSQMSRNDDDDAFAPSIQPLQRQQQPTTTSKSSDKEDEDDVLPPPPLPDSLPPLPDSLPPMLDHFGMDSTDDAALTTGQHNHQQTDSFSTEDSGLDRMDCTNPGYDELNERREARNCFSSREDLSCDGRDSLVGSPHPGEMIRGLASPTNSDADSGIGSAKYERRRIDGNRGEGTHLDLTLKCLTYTPGIR